MNFYIIIMASSMMVSGCDLASQTNKAQPFQSQSADLRWQRIMSHPLPDSDLVEKIETSLSKLPCVGRLSKWQRNYSFGLSEDLQNVNARKVEIDLRQAGIHGFAPQINIRNAFGSYSNDDREYDVVIGSYSLDTSRIEIEHCGPNR